MNKSGALVFAYTAQAIADGVLVDVSTLAKEAGLREFGVNALDPQDERVRRTSTIRAVMKPPSSRSSCSRWCSLRMPCAWIFYTQASGVRPSLLCKLTSAPSSCTGSPQWYWVVSQDR